MWWRLFYLVISFVWIEPTFLGKTCWTNFWPNAADLLGKNAIGSNCVPPPPIWSCQRQLCPVDLLIVNKACCTHYNGQLEVWFLAVHTLKACRPVYKVCGHFQHICLERVHNTKGITTPSFIYAKDHSAMLL